MRKSVLVFLAIISVFVLSGCNGVNSGREAVVLAPNQVTKLSDFSMNQFNHKLYVRGMAKIARNTLYWQDPSANLGGYRSVSIDGPTDEYLPINPNIIHQAYVKGFGGFFDSNLNLKKDSNGESLRVVTAVVECNPGSRAARYWVGMGAGKAVATVVVEVYEPGKDTPSLKIYSRDTASAGGFGGDSMSMMNHIFQVMAVRVTTVLEGRIDL